MSNHSGSYMLNDVLCTAKDMNIFETIGREKARKFALEIIKISRQYDCNYGEILDNNVGQEVGICYCCLAETDDIDDDGLCKECRG